MNYEFVLLKKDNILKRQRKNTISLGKRLWFPGINFIVQLLWALKTIQDNMNFMKHIKDESKGTKAEIQNKKI